MTTYEAYRDAFAHAVGGETIDAELDIIDECWICCDDTIY